MCPTYDFICDTCGLELEQLVPITCPKISKCPNCLENTLIRCIGTGGGIIFKGGGFYETDYKQIKDAVKKNNQINQERSDRAKEDEDF
jgi:putative FmdB family regulatory protein